MNQSGLKNMVVLRNLPSNLIEEAIIVLKSNKNIKQIEKIDKNKVKEEPKEKVKERDYIQKEAEMLISNYIKRLEDRKKEKIENRKQENKKYLKSHSLHLRCQCARPQGGLSQKARSLLDCGLRVLSCTAGPRSQSR